MHCLVALSARLATLLPPLLPASPGAPGPFHGHITLALLIPALLLLPAPLAVLIVLPLALQGGEHTQEAAADDRTGKQQHADRLWGHLNGLLLVLPPKVLPALGCTRYILNCCSDALASWKQNSAYYTVVLLSS
jgi:hypothetical protein